ncbi:hypothetical protein K503DRAFT_771829 [Rhizopogon vinicolor AM-OR11-026]|uniref:Uncharacterized protein n=1 Tax=Rhizopogon vinicolor AM-OR11-026 TaxID=1314800 RepID=A0A1B7MWX4_9AGAM|nr:hypothetical protein K503DRAFT_771829 [Rhizopogon vinicolor AM-OR11-026]
MHQSGAPSRKVAVTAASVRNIEVLLITIVQRARTTGMHSGMPSRRRELLNRWGFNSASI